jgi:uncharacterized protein HemX
MPKKKKIVLILAVLLVFGAGVGFYFYNKKKQVEQEPEATPESKGILPGTPLTMESQVQALYRELLGREADTSRLAYWTAQANTSSIENVRNQFMASPEYKARISKVA